MDYSDADGDTLKIGLGLVDEDDIPELFLCTGAYTTCGVHIYKYDANMDDIKYLGEFSQYGFCKYAKKRGVIWSQTGNNGYFEELFCMMTDKGVKVIGRLLSANGTDCEIYYGGYTSMLPGFTRVNMDVAFVYDKEYLYRIPQHHQK